MSVGVPQAAKVRGDFEPIKIINSQGRLYKPINSYFFSFKPLYKNLSISQGSTSIAIATRYNSEALKNELRLVVKRVILVLLMPVLSLTCDLLTDRCAKNRPKSVSVSLSFAAKRKLLYS